MVPPQLWVKCANSSAVDAMKKLVLCDGTLGRNKDGCRDEGTTGLALKDDKVADRGGRPLLPLAVSHGVPLLQALSWLLISSRALGECPAVPTSGGALAIPPAGHACNPALTYLSGMPWSSWGGLRSPTLLPTAFALPGTCHLRCACLRFRL